MVQTTITSTDTNTTTSSCSYPCPYLKPRAEQGWECPRCGRINAPWVRSCDCNRDTWTVNWTSDKTTVSDRPGWWKEVTCHDDNIMNNPTTYQVGGSDYKQGNTYVNVSGTQTNKVDPNTTAWSCTPPDIAINNFTTYRTDVPKTYTTETVVNDGIHNFYNLKTSKENK